MPKHEVPSGAKRYSCLRSFREIPNALCKLPHVSHFNLLVFNHLSQIFQLSSCYWFLLFFQKMMSINFFTKTSAFSTLAFSWLQLWGSWAESGETSKSPGEAMKRKTSFKNTGNLFKKWSVSFRIKCLIVFSFSVSFFSVRFFFFLLPPYYCSCCSLRLESNLESLEKRLPGVATKRLLHNVEIQLWC